VEYIFGTDIAGTVVAVGSGPGSRFKIGQRVIGYTSLINYSVPFLSSLLPTILIAPPKLSRSGAKGGRRDPLEGYRNINFSSGATVSI
jgi:NADPH:quinone reductase-like Zn-dependent oxidoreductase